MSKYSIPPVYFVSSMAMSILFSIVFPSMNFVKNPYNLFGLVFCATGGIIVLFAKPLFSKHKTTHGFTESTAIISEGIFAHSRNPLYLGMICTASGVSILSTNVLSLFPALSLWAIIQYKFIPFEEQKMEKEFGENYLEYKRKVRRWI